MNMLKINQLYFLTIYDYNMEQSLTKCNMFISLSIVLLISSCHLINCVSTIRVSDIDIVMNRFNIYSGYKVTVTEITRIRDCSQK